MEKILIKQIVDKLENNSPMKAESNPKFEEHKLVEKKEESK